MPVFRKGEKAGCKVVCKQGQLAGAAGAVGGKGAAVGCKSEHWLQWAATVSCGAVSCDDNCLQNNTIVRELGSRVVGTDQSRWGRQAGAKEIPALLGVDISP